MAGRTRAVQVRNRRTVAEVVIHDLLGIECAHEDVTAAHVDYFLYIFAAGVDVAPKNVLARHVWAVTRETFDDLVGELVLECLIALSAEIRINWHDVPAISRMLAWWGLCRIKQA